MAKKDPKFRPSQPPNRGERISSHAVSRDGSTNGLTPVFNLQHLAGDYCLSKCDVIEKAAFADTLHRLSKMTWSQIQTAPRKGLGTEIIARSSLGKRSYPSELTVDVNIIAFRFCGNAPMIGYRIGRVFNVLFLDRDFTLYDHE